MRDRAACSCPAYFPSEHSRQNRSAPLPAAPGCSGAFPSHPPLSIASPSIDAQSLHDSSQSSVTNLTTGVISSNVVENVSTIPVDWSTLVVEPKIDGDEKPVDEKAMFALLGIKIEAEGVVNIPVVAPIPDYEQHDVKEVALVDDQAPEEPLIVWDERKPLMDIGTPYPDMVAFRKALKQFAINREFEYGTKKNEPERL
ncbi:hypothetical protein ACQ4PT_069045 [Festuca glaucescens]